MGNRQIETHDNHFRGGWADVSVDKGGAHMVHSNQSNFTVQSIQKETEDIYRRGIRMRHCCGLNILFSCPED